MARRVGAGVRLLTRNGHDWTDRYPLVAAAATAISATSFLIDGEVAVCDENGLAVFDRLRAFGRVTPAAIMLAFDLIHLNGEDLRRVPIETRKHRLLRLLRRPHPGIRLSEHIETEGQIVFHHACQLGCEGIVSKRKGSPYTSGRTRDWIKVKNPASPAVRRIEEEDWRR